MPHRVQFRKSPCEGPYPYLHLTDRAHTQGFHSTLGYYKTLKYGPHRPTIHIGKIVHKAKNLVTEIGKKVTTYFYQRDIYHCIRYLKTPQLKNPPLWSNENFEKDDLKPPP